MPLNQFHGGFHKHPDTETHKNDITQSEMDSHIADFLAKGGTITTSDSELTNACGISKADSKAWIAKNKEALLIRINNHTYHT